MKKKHIIIIVLVVGSILALVGYQGDGYSRERFYGVVRWSEECNQLVVYIPEVGEVEIPDCDSCWADFDGYEENEDDSYQLKAGDFVVINFKYKKSWKENSVKIMESYPARFDRKASSIDALNENIWYEKIDSGYQLSFSSSDQTLDFNIGDTIYFVYHGGENGVAYQQLVADGIVSDITDEKVTVNLNILNSEKEFFEKFVSITIEKSWGK